MSSGDLNGDGIPDLVIVNDTPTQAHVLIGDGSGGFTDGETLQVSVGADKAELADLDRDGDLDVVVPAGISLGRLHIHLNNGSGFFTEQPVGGIGVQPGAIDVAIGDIDGDGIPDFVVAEFEAETVSVYRGNGSGGFATVLALLDLDTGASTDDGPVSVAIGDFDRDGDQDLAVTIPGRGEVEIFRNSGNGSFPSSSTVPTTTAPWLVETADLTKDGILDLVLSALFVIDDTVTVLQGDGGTSPGFTEVANSPFTLTEGPRSVVIGDLNGDGNLDLAAGNTSITGSISILEGDGQGDFTLVTPDIPSGGRNAYSLVVDDLNRDGRPDLAVVNGADGSPQNVSVLLNTTTFDPAGVFGTGVNVSVGTGPIALAIGDLNRDSIPDLAVANSGSNNVSVLLGNGNGTFSAAPDVPAGTRPVDIAIGDLNRDGRPDLAMAAQTTGSAITQLGLAAGGFGAGGVWPAGTAPTGIAIGDLNRDGRPDLVVANGTSGDISVLRGLGNGTFLSAINTSVQVGLRRVAIGDLNGDGLLDVAVTNANTSTVTVLFGTGAGTFSGGAVVPTGTAPIGVAIGDLNRDGIPDLATANFTSDDVSVVFGLGGGTFGTATQYATSFEAQAVAIGDLNRDGVPDLAVANANLGNVSVLLGIGNGTFGTATNSATGAGPNGIAIGDLDQDGKLDLATANFNSDNASVLLNSANTAPTVTSPTPPNVVTNEGQAVNILLTGSDPDGDLLTFSVPASAGPSIGTLPANPLGSCTPAPGSSCNILVTYTPTGDNFGADSFAFLVNDGSVDSAAVTVDLTVNPVNDQPSFTHAGNQAVLEDAGAQSVAGWVTNFNPGPANEASQAAAAYAVISNDNPGLFAVQPAVAPNGTLTYTPALHANGVANLQVTVRDDGTTANGGIDTSAPQGFSITVTPVNDAPVFDTIPDQSVKRVDAAAAIAAQSIAITGLAPGPGGATDEATQTVSVSVTNNSNPGLITNVVLSGTGATRRLAFQPVGTLTGTATIEVTAMDTGSGAAPNVNASVQSFTIGVLAPGAPDRALTLDLRRAPAGAFAIVQGDTGPVVATGFTGEVVERALPQGDYRLELPDSGSPVSLPVTLGTNDCDVALR